jgi:Carbohydrate family 9 binding domain-like
MTLRTRTLVALFVVLPNADLAAAPSATAVRAEGALELDGSLDEPAWAQAAWSSGFRDASNASTNAGVAAVQTRFKVLFDASALMVGVECDEPNPAGIVAQATAHDGNVWADDCVEVFFDPAGEGRYYHHFVVNSRGAWYDDYSADYGLVHGKLWDCAIETAAVVQTEARRWSVEVRIPFAGLQLPDEPASTWRWNVAHERYAGGAQELSSWSPLKGNFHQPRLFGTLGGIEVDFDPFALRLGPPGATISGAGSGIRQVQISLPVEESGGRPRKLAGSLELFGQPATRVTSEPLDLPAGAKGEVTFPALQVRDSLADALCLVALRDAESGSLLRSAVIGISTEYRPLTLTVLRPVYRNCIFATESLKQLEFRIALADDIAPRTVSLRYGLRADGGKEAGRGSAKPDALSGGLSLDVARLPVGRYVLSAEAVDADGKAIATAEETIRKLPPPPAGNEVRIDEHRRILVNGKPWLGIGWYGNIPTEDPRADVVALQNVQTPVVITYPDAAPIRDAFNQHGVYSIASMENGRLLYTFELWKQKDSPIPDELKRLSAPSEEMKGYVRKLIEAVRGEPGLVGYYIADEPEINEARSDYLEALYKLLAEEDPYHPVVVTNDTLDGIITHGYKCADILNPDPYSPEFDYVPNFCKRVLQVASRGKATMVTLWHSSSQAHTTADYGTAPPYPYRVFRNQYLSSICYGAVGFTAYTTSFFMPEVEYRYGLPYVWRELRFLEKAVLSPPPAEELRVESTAEMGRWIRDVDGRVYLIVTNHKPGDRRARISHPLLAKLSRLAVVSENREVEVKGGAFSDEFKEGDAHVYTTDPAGVGFATTEEVTAELADREKATVKEGNLLHWRRGTRAAASPGYYAPWFDQYYYYAVNGITDDLGWYCSHWDGKSAWLELTLKQPSPIGRVVIYSPNLADYELQLTGPDGSKRVARIAGNERSPIEHTFRPAPTCLKLRLTAFAARPGAKPDRPLVSEIEAYAEPGAGEVTPLIEAAAPEPAPAIPFRLEGEPNALWADDFTQFEFAEKYNWDGKDTKWVLNPTDLRARPRPGGGVALASTAAVGYAGMSHLFPYDPACRFFQVKLSGIEGEGYRFASVSFGDSSGKPGYRGAVNTNRPGIYTVDTYAIHPSYADGSARGCFVVVGAAGSAKERAGPEFTFDWLRLVRRPTDGLVVTMADGSPLPEELKQGDELLLYLDLAERATDATVEVMTGSAYSPLAVNGEPYVQLVKAGQGDGREWAAKVKLGADTGTFDQKANGYPTVFRARISGGAIGETYASAFVSFR